MLTHPNFDPVALAIGPLQIHWYGLMYLLGFAGAWWLGMLRTRQPHTLIKTNEHMSDLIFYGALGVVLGGRLGYVLIYDFSATLANPVKILQVWQGGMSFHGGLLGVMCAMWLYGRKLNRTFFEVTDFIAPLVPLGLGFGRLGNFINGELWGRPTDVPWGMVFHDPYAGQIARHPSQLYEAVLEGLALFIVLWFYSRKPRPTMAVSGLFLIAYGVFRSFAEFFRTPDLHLGFIAFDWLTMGQLLSLPMIIAGICLMWLAYRKPHFSTPVQADNAETAAKS